MNKIITKILSKRIFIQKKFNSTNLTAYSGWIREGNKATIEDIELRSSVYMPLLKPLQTRVLEAHNTPLQI